MRSLSWLMIMTAMSCDGYKILVVFPNPSRSHGSLGDGVVRHLLNDGHQVTYITPFVKDTPQQNLTYVAVRNTQKSIAGTNTFSIKKLMTKETKLDQESIFHFMWNISQLAFENENVKKLLESSETFDVIVAEWMFNELYSGFAAVFKCPYIWVYPFEPNFVGLRLIDEATNPAYTANFELSIVPPFTFLERISNLWFQISHSVKQYIYFDPLEKALYDETFAPIQLKKHGYVIPYDELRYNASLMLSYSYHALGQALRIPQNLIPVGGYHVDENPPPLPMDLQKLMDEATEGVIYFSMGSNLNSKDFPKYILTSLMNIFADIKHTIIWKFEDQLSGYSKNVHILKWTPQQSILAHPNCILFITHGGLLSTTEAIHFGVPIIGIPVFYDQFGNVDRAVGRGFAKKVLLTHNFADDLKTAIEDIVTDSKYTIKAKELSYIYHDRPVPPGRTLAHWIRHVVATRGAPHLRSPALQLSWYQKYYLDLTAILILLLASLMFGLVKLVARCRQYCVNILKKKVC